MILSNFSMSSSRGSFLGSGILLLVFTVFLLKVSNVSSMAEDYYNPDYDEDEILNPANWGGILPEKRHLGSMAKGLKFSRVVKSEQDGDGFGNSNIKNNLDENHPFYFNPALHASDPSLDQEEVNPNSLSQFMESEVRVKDKRFLGALARGGWFPRQFRGVVEPQWDKRHIGAAARLGWMPYKIRSDENFKRNLGSIRKSKERFPISPIQTLHR